VSAPAAAGYRSEVVGSLLRPAYLKEAVAQHEVGALDADALAAAQDRAVREAIALQEACDLDVLADGEMRRQGWTDPLTAGLAGFSLGQTAPVAFADRQTGGREIVRLPACTERLSRRANLPLRDARFLRAHTRRPFKVTLPALSHASVLWVPGISDRAYPDRQEYLRDVQQLVHGLVAELVADGVRYVQFDAPRYTHLASEEGLANFRRVGIDSATWLDEMIALDNSVIAAFPDVTFAMHLCRGNARSRWSVAGGYDAFAERLFDELRVSRLLLEHDSPRAGSFEPLRFVPADKTVVLGLITTKEPELESAALLRRRVDEASRYVPLERLALSPQCGFASTLAGNLLTEADQRAKLELLGRVARDIWR
jgi:5-methyltetrahydropteroyltriglutamate--homocysteine methyltransferase